MAANTLESAPATDSAQKAPAESHPLKADITPKDLREVFGYLRGGAADDAAKREADLLSGKGLDFSAQDIYQKSMKELENFGSAPKAGAHKGDAEKNDPLKGQPAKGENHKPADKPGISDKDLGAALGGRQHKVEAPTGSPFDQIHKHYKELTNSHRYLEPGNYITGKDLDSALKARH